MNERSLLRAYGIPPDHIPTAERLADEAPKALGHALEQAWDHLVSVDRWLELEATDPRVRKLRERTADVRRELAQLMVEVGGRPIE